MQNNFGYQNDVVEVGNFLDKRSILAYVSEEEIFELVFGFQPVEYDYVCSPFREDTNPGCFFELGLYSGKLKFVDFGDPYFKSEDCFSCVQRFYKLSSFYDTIRFIKEALIDGKNLPFRSYTQKQTIQKKEGSNIAIEIRNFTNFDKIYWSKYHISKQNLVDDKTLPIRKYRLKNDKGNDFTSVVQTLCYAISDFESGAKKLYFPHRIGKKRFITNCTKNDIGGIRTLNNSKQLLIGKSYKDDRVVKNQMVNSMWFQNEGMFPDEDILFPILEEYEDVPILFDNDETGMKASAKLVEYINASFPNLARSIFIPPSNKGVTDPSDLLFLKGRQKLIQFLYENNVLCKL